MENVSCCKYCGSMIHSNATFCDNDCETAYLERENQWVWTDELVLEYAKYYRFSSSRTSIKQWKESYLKNQQ